MIAAGNRRLRVLVMTLGRRGGVAEYGWLMTRALAERADVGVVSALKAENHAKWSGLDVPHLVVNTFATVPGVLLSFLAVARFAAIWKFGKRFSPDIIYYTGGHAWKPLLDLILPHSAKVVLTVHDPGLHPGEDYLPHRFLAWANRLRVDGYVLLNEVQRRPFTDRYGIDERRVAVIPHGIFDDYPRDPAVLDLTEDLRPLRSMRGRYLLFVGRILPYKGLSVLLRAYRTVADRIGMPLVVAGSGELTEDEQTALAALPADSVFFVNRWLEPEEIGGLVASARFVVLPYISATQSGVIPMASALGVPAIASDSEGLVEQLVDGRTGLAFRAGDVEDLADALLRADQLDEHAYSTMSAACEDYARDHWGWDRLSVDLLDFFNDLPGRS